MKNKICKSLISAILIIGLNARASAEDTPVDNSVKYGEKYACAIITSDEKSYTLDVEWNVEPAKYSKTPQWQEKLIYTLKLDQVQVDSGYFSDLGWGYSKTEFAFKHGKYVFVGSASQSTRVGTNYSDANIELTKAHDHDGKTVFSVAKFISSHSFDKFYGGVKEVQTVLAIKESTCVVVATAKQQTKPWGCCLNKPMKKIILLVPLFFGLSLFAADPKDYFKDSFDESAAAFDQAYLTVKKIQPKAELYEFTFDQGTIKSIYWPAKKKTEKLLVLFSGTHGIEAFVGSAVQRWLVDQPYMQNREDINVLMVHGLNVYGFKNKRRVNEQNIDLNRNFIVDRSQFVSDDSGYKKLYDYLNPTSDATYGFLSEAKFVWTAIVKIARYGLENLRNSVLRGQYSYPEGLYYGGNMTVKQWDLLNQLIDKYVIGHKRLFVIDLHTGYGTRGKLHLLANGKREGNPLTQIFTEENEIDYGSDKKFYTVQGELLSFFIHEIKYKLKDKAPESVGITFEYGTLNSQKTTGSIESLRRMVYENQNFWHPSQDPQVVEKIKTDFVEMFNPSDVEWRKTILDQTENKTKKIIDWLSK